MRITLGELRRVIREVVESEMMGPTGQMGLDFGEHPSIQAVLDMIGPGWERQLAVVGKTEAEKIKAAEVWLKNTRAREAGPGRGSQQFGDDRSPQRIGVNPNDIYGGNY
jgi:hypothetical protein